MISKVCIYSFLLGVGIHVVFSKTGVRAFENEADFENFLDQVYERNASQTCTRTVHAEWDFATDVNNKEKENAQLEATLISAENRKYYWEEFFGTLNADSFQTEANKRQAKKLKILGSAALSTSLLTQLTNIENNMTATYSTARICPFTNQKCNLTAEGLTLEPGIESILSSSTDYDELTYVWKAWRDASGAKIREQYKTYVELSNEAAKANGFRDMGEMWREDYETENFTTSLDSLWEQVKPLYDALHTYVARKLRVRYGNRIDLSDGLIPANILGNMWAQSWVNLASFVKPFPNASTVDITKALQDQEYNVLKMFQTSNEFYMSLGLADNSISYNVSAGAMIEKPSDKDVLCHASAWDFCDGENYRIKMCTNVDFEDFVTIHHEMGHIQYYLQYKDQHITFREGANPGFHEAVGDTIALSVSTPQHLEKIGLLSNYQDTEEASINALMDMALERVAFLPFGLLIDKWRWDVFSGQVTEDQWNAHWWQYRQTIQKVKPPVERSETDFDPGAKYHVAGDSQYINYFVAHILEFQLYRGLCIAAGQYNPEDPSVPLHKCDFYNSTIAGDKLKAGLSLGSSKHWSEALYAMTGETDLDATALLQYFAPLFDYLNRTNEEGSTEAELETFLYGEYAKEAQKIYSASVQAEWDFATDVNNEEKQQAQLNATLDTAAFNKRMWEEHFRNLNETDFQQELIQRQVKMLRVLGNSALDPDKLTQLTTVTNTMTATYSSARICPFTNQNCNITTEGLTLEPGIESIMATSTDYNELVYAWTAWRSASGAKMRDQYKIYVDLSNEAAKANGYADKGEMWRYDFESPTFVQDMDELWEQVSPLYEALHTYVGFKLKQRYVNLDTSDGLIPAHVFGNMWAQSWINLASLVKPYSNASVVDVTAALKANNYTVLKMFEASNDFYKSLGLKDNSISYDVSAGALIEKPTDRDVLCHASAWDFYDGENFRIKMCTEVNYEDFITIHHEMGHIQYFIQYKDQPITLRGGANPGFHEAIGDTIALSVATPTHLKKIHLIENYEDSEADSINALMDMALERVAFLPFGLLIDKWRWDVFNGTVSQDQWNEHWWHYRKTIQKVKPPVSRSENDFDPGAKYHVPGDSRYISYFVAHILEFQLYRALCIAANQYDPIVKDPPLHLCDFFDSKEAGNKLQAGLQYGQSKHWKDALEAMTGERDLDASAILEYFEPLYNYLKEQNGNSSLVEESCKGKQETTDQTVPIVVGSVLGGLLLIIIAIFAYKRYKSR